MWSNNVVLILATLCLLSLVPQPTQGLSCVNCADHDCGPRPNCKHGLVKDQCNCCMVCGKGPGETCWEFEVACAPGLECVFDKNAMSVTGKCARKSRPKPRRSRRRSTK